MNGQKTTYQVEARALLKGKDYSQVIRKMGISIKDYGKDFPRFFTKLPEKDRQTLINRGLVLFDNGVAFPTWTVSLKYYWKQVFPANSTISIRHTYEPHKGYDVFSQNRNKYLKDACVTDEIAQWLHSSPPYIKIRYVKYILLTANNWKQPIKDFHLVVEEPSLQNNPEGWRISVCFDHELAKTSNNRFETFIKNYIPKKNLAVYLFYR